MIPQVNVLIDSECRARLADFGLAAIVDETTSKTTVLDGKMKGTTRWMAPELFFPDRFGFTGKLAKQLPSRETDIYAIGMTILEVSVRPFLSRIPNLPQIGSNGMRSIRQCRS